MNALVNELKTISEFTFAQKLNSIVTGHVQKGVRHYKSNYLCWPVTFNETSLHGIVKYHVTCKYFGEQFISPDEVESYLENLDLTGPEDLSWSPEDWSRPGAEVYVLKLDKAPRRMFTLNKSLDFISQDDYEYTPHISVEKDLWYKIIRQNLVAQDLNAKVEPLCLMSGVLKLAQFPKGNF